MEKDPDLSTLLRLKRYEQPPPEYFENFLRDFQRRQRTDLLRQPLWQLAWERVSAFFSEPAASRFAYATATALVLLTAGVASMKILDTPEPTLVAQTPPASILRLGRPVVQLPDFNELSRNSTNSAVVSLRPRYVMDARPVSYEPASSF